MRPAAPEAWVFYVAQACNATAVLLNGWGFQSAIAHGDLARANLHMVWAAGLLFGLALLPVLRRILVADAVRAEAEGEKSRAIVEEVARLIKAGQLSISVDIDGEIDEGTTH